MKALSIRQPWAWAILFAGKDVENRSWPAYYNGTVLIHAAKKYDNQGRAWIEERMGIAVPRQLPLGGIVGRVEVTGCMQRCPSAWSAGRYQFLLRDPRPLDFLPWPGRLGFFDFPSELLTRFGFARAEIEAMKKHGRHTRT